MRIVLSQSKPKRLVIKQLLARIKKHKPKTYYDDCPYCGSFLIVRFSGDYHRFMGCLSYPKCRFTAEEKLPHVMTNRRTEGAYSG